MDIQCINIVQNDIRKQNHFLQSQIMAKSTSKEEDLEKLDNEKMKENL